MSLHDFLKIVRQRWLVIVLATLIAAGVMFALTPANRDTTPRIGSYTAKATLLVGTRTAAPTTSSRTDTPVELDAPATLARIALFVTTGEVPVRAAARLGYTGDPALLAAGLTVESDPASQSLTIATTASDGARAAEVANAFAEETVAFFDEAPPGSGNTALAILQPATPIPNQSTSGFVIPPDRNIRTALAAALGLLFGLAVALLLDRLDNRLRTREEIGDALGMPIIGDVPRLKRGDRSPGKVLTVAKPLSVYADGYRAVRTALMHAPRPASHTEDRDTPRRASSGHAPRAAQSHNSRLVLVTSSHAGEGKTTSVANLAASFAETGQRVLCLDADLRNPDMHAKFDVPQGAGISDFLSDPRGYDLESLLRPTSVPGVQVVTAGTRLDAPASLTSRVAPLLEEARALADVVIIDTAPLLAASDVFDILPSADTIVLVVRSGRLTNNAAHRVAELLSRFRVPVLGAIVIGAPVRKADYGYSYGYGEGRQRRRGADARAPLPQRPNAAQPENHPSGGAEVSPSRFR